LGAGRVCFGKGEAMPPKPPAVVIKCEERAVYLTSSERPARGVPPGASAIFNGGGAHCGPSQPRSGEPELHHGGFVVGMGSV